MEVELPDGQIITINNPTVYRVYLKNKHKFLYAVRPSFEDRHYIFFEDGTYLISSWHFANEANEEKVFSYWRVSNVSGKLEFNHTDFKSHRYDNSRLMHYSFAPKLLEAINSKIEKTLLGD